MLITVSDIEDYTGDTYDSDDSQVVQSVIDAVSNFVECYTGQKFTDGIYSQRIHVIDGQFNLKNNCQHFYAVGYGVTELIIVTAPSQRASIEISEQSDGTYALKLIDGFTATHLTIDTDTLTEVKDAIDGESGWSAELADDIDLDYGRILYEGTFRANTDDSNKIRLYGASNRLDASKLSNKLFQSSVECSEGVAIYRGGYSTLPSDLKDAVIRFTIKAYQDRNSAVTGDLKRERIGDYEFEVQTGSDQQSLQTLAINYYSVLDCYKNKDI